MPAKAIAVAVTCVSLIWVGAGSRAAEVAPAASKPKVERFERIDFALPIDRRYQNPFDAEEVAVSLQVKTPRGERLVVPAFFCQDYERRKTAKGGKPGDWVYPRGQPAWRARFAAAEVGTYEAGFEVKDRGLPLQSGSVRFSCVQSERKGFLQVSPAQPALPGVFRGAALLRAGAEPGVHRAGAVRHPLESGGDLRQVLDQRRQFSADLDGV